MLGESALRGIEYYIFFMDSGALWTGEARSHALQGAMKRAHVFDLQLDFSFPSHVMLMPSRQRLSPAVDFR